MSTNTKLSVKSASYLDDKKTVTNTINYINPNLSDEKALELGQRMNALTLNTYKSTSKIETTELDTSTKYPYPITSMDYVQYNPTAYPNINLENPAINLSTSRLNSSNTFLIRIITPFLGTAPIVTFDSNNWVASSVQYGLTGQSGIANNTWTIKIATEQATVQAEQTTCHIHFHPVENYKAFDIDIPFIITEG